MHWLTGQVTGKGLILAISQRNLKKRKKEEEEEKNG